ncbi:nicotinate-nucleotide--dimethylbenzimidazole phosphoribosyltransferase [Streptomyces sp. NPDC047108]|uniref:nicotinate-nucleotide--dimethylbenzimidazole phosphoribosyltransferase n=1 Tax=Streptomyces sp. NPDC047108 TaxID=3155025 RepID=UPI0033CAF557
MTDTGQVPGEGLPENAGGQQETPRYAAPATPAGSGLPEQPGSVPAPGAYAFHDPAENGAGGGEEEDALLMPGAQGAWGDLPAGAVPPPTHAHQAHQQHPHGVPQPADPSAGYPQAAAPPQAQQSPYHSVGHPHAYVPHQAQQPAEQGIYEPGIHGTHGGASLDPRTDTHTGTQAGPHGATHDGAPAAHDGTHAGTHAGTHETGGRDTGSVDYGAVRMPQQSSASQSVSQSMTAPSHPSPVSATPPAGTPTSGRRPLHRGPQGPDTSGGVVRSLADRGPAGARTQGAGQAMPVPGPGPVPGPEYLDVPPEESAVVLSVAAYADQYAASLPGPQLGEIPPQSAHWDMQPVQNANTGRADRAAASATASAEAHAAAGHAPAESAAFGRAASGPAASGHEGARPAAAATTESVATGGGSGADGTPGIPRQAPDATQHAPSPEPTEGHTLAGPDLSALPETSAVHGQEPVPDAAPAQDPSAHPESGDAHGAAPESEQVQGAGEQPPVVAGEDVHHSSTHGQGAGTADGSPATADGSPATGTDDAPAEPNAADAAAAESAVIEPTDEESSDGRAAAQASDPQPAAPATPLPEEPQPASEATAAESAQPTAAEGAPDAGGDAAADATGQVAAQPEEPVVAHAADVADAPAAEPAPEPSPEAAAQPWPEAPVDPEAQAEQWAAAEHQQVQEAEQLAEPVAAEPVAEAVTAEAAAAGEAGGAADQDQPDAGRRPVLADELVAPKSRTPQAAAEPAAEEDATGAAETPADAEAPAAADAEADTGTPIAAEAEAEAPDDPQAVERARAEGYGDAEREAVLRVIRERRDIRNGFRSDPVPHDVLLRVLEAAHTAPSVGHSQPWDFVVIRSAETRRTMHELAMRQREAYAKSLPKGRAKQFKQLKIEAILDTPVNIVVTADPTRGGRHTLGRHTQPQMAPYSSALAVENLWLAARAEGLGVGWVSFFDEREMVRALGLPDHLEVVAYLCVGYVDEFPDEPELMQSGWSKRRPLSWVVHEETYGRRALPGAEPHDLLAETLQGIRPLDAKALGEAWERQKRMTKPAGALGMLEIISAQLSGLSRQCPPPIPEPAAVAVFAGDHGVHAQGVTPWPQEVTAQMVANFLGGGAVCNAFANQVGAEVCVVDVGVAGELPSTPGLLPRKVRPGTGDFTTGPALTQEEVLRAIEVGIETARDLVAAGNKALLSGEMGIANTTVSAALISVYTGLDPAEVTGRGTGINDETHARKVDVVRRALELHQPDPGDPIGVLTAIGGLEHAAIVGLLLGAASLRTPVILDGVSAGAAALVARAIAPEVLAACIAGHRSAEPGHVAALTKLGLRPLVDLDLRLGEGTGALLALPLVQSAARAMHEVATFDSAGVTEKA